MTRTHLSGDPVAFVVGSRILLRTIPGEIEESLRVRSGNWDSTVYQEPEEGAAASSGRRNWRPPEGPIWCSLPEASLTGEALSLGPSILSSTGEEADALTCAILSVLVEDVIR